MANELQEGVPPKPIPRTSSNLKKLLLILNGALMFHVICYETSWITIWIIGNAARTKHIFSYKLIVLHLTYHRSIYYRVITVSSFVDLFDCGVITIIIVFC